MAKKDADDNAGDIEEQINKAGLPTGGSVPFVPQLERNRKGKQIIKKKAVESGPRKSKKGYVDSQGRVWLRDRAHAGYADHWDVQENGGKKGYFRVGDDGEIIP